MPRPLNVLWLVSDHQALANRPTLSQGFDLQARLAREGLRFSRAYTVLPVCSPARASMITGLYPHAHGLTENDGRFGGRAGLEPEDWMIHGPFLDAGYRCAWFGKWHLNHHRAAQDHGFEGVSLPGYGYPYATEAYRDYLQRRGLAPPVAEIEIPGESGLAVGTRVDLMSADDWFDYESGAARLDGPAETHEAYFVADLAARWLDEIGETPFFLRVDPWGPHPPYLSAAPFRGMLDGAVVDPSSNLALDLTHRPDHHRQYRDYWTETLGLDRDGWRRMVVRSLEQVALVEAALVKLLDTLDRLGLAERTLVIFTADHGDAVGSNGGVANKGGLMVEETMRVPLLFRGPGVVQGRICDRLAANLDIAPTLLRLCGLETAAELHGESLHALLRDPDAPGRRALMAQHYGLHEPILQRAYYEDRWKLVLQEDGFTEFYDLRRDPCELHNLARSAEHRPALDRLRAGLRQSMQAVGDSNHDLMRHLFRESSA